jgi:hypothetical protein
LLKIQRLTNSPASSFNLPIAFTFQLSTYNPGKQINDPTNKPAFQLPVSAFYFPYFFPLR